MMPALLSKCADSPQHRHALSARPPQAHAYHCRPSIHGSPWSVPQQRDTPSTLTGSCSQCASALRAVVEHGWQGGHRARLPRRQGLSPRLLSQLGGVRPARRRWDECGAQAAGHLPQPGAAPQGPAARSGPVATERSCTLRTCPRCTRPCSALATVPWGRPVAWRISAGRSPCVPAAVRAARICP